jgi:hypothetical protein
LMTFDIKGNDGEQLIEDILKRIQR